MRGGACACATCHVYVKDGWYEKLPAPSDAEIDMLDMALAVEPGSSRLSCQIVCSEETDGIKGVTVAPGVAAGLQAFGPKGNTCWTAVPP